MSLITRHNNIILFILPIVFSCSHTTPICWIV